MKFENLVESLEKLDKQYDKPVAKKEAFRQILEYINHKITLKAERVESLDEAIVEIFHLNLNSYNQLRLEFHLELVQLEAMQFSKFNASEIYDQLHLDKLKYVHVHTESKFVVLEQVKSDHHEACPETLTSVVSAKKFRPPSNPGENIIKMRINTLLIQYFPLPQSVNYLVLEYLIFCIDSQFENRCTTSLKEILKHTGWFECTKSKYLINFLNWSLNAMITQIPSPDLQWMSSNTDNSIKVSQDALIMFEKTLVHNIYNHSDFIETYIQFNYKINANLVLYMRSNDSAATAVLRKTILNFLSLIFLIVHINPKLWQLVLEHGRKGVKEKLMKLNNSVKEEEDKEFARFMMETKLLDDPKTLSKKSPYQKLTKAEVSKEHETKVVQLYRKRRVLETDLLLQGFFSDAEDQKRTFHRSRYIMHDQQTQRVILALTPSEKQKLTKFYDSHRDNFVEPSFPTLKKKVLSLFIKLEKHFVTHFAPSTGLKAPSLEQRELVSEALTQVDILKKEIDVSSNRNQLKSIIGKASETPLTMEKWGIFDELKRLSNDLEDNMPYVTDFPVYP